MFNLSDWSEQRRAQVDTTLLAAISDAHPPRFAKAVRYPVQSGGKRIRPLLCLAACEALGAEPNPVVLGASAAVELIHTYSLVHDDLPAMDDDDVRRGRPTVHVAFDEGTAVLVGDALLTEAFALLARLDAPAELCVALIGELATAAGHRGMVGGQAIDVGLGGPVSDVDRLIELHRGKTGALIRAAVRMGAIAGGASADQLASLTRYGEAIGLAFQLADDVLDEKQDQGEAGPPSFVKLLGVDETLRRARALLDEALSAIADLPSPAALDALARFTVERDH